MSQYRKDFAQGMKEASTGAKISKFFSDLMNSKSQEDIIGSIAPKSKEATTPPQATPTAPNSLSDSPYNRR